MFLFVYKLSFIFQSSDSEDDYDWEDVFEIRRYQAQLMLKERIELRELQRKKQLADNLVREKQLRDRINEGKSKRKALKPLKKKRNEIRSSVEDEDVEATDSLKVMKKTEDLHATDRMPIWEDFNFLQARGDEHGNEGALVWQPRNWKDLDDFFKPKGEYPIKGMEHEDKRSNKRRIEPEDYASALTVKKSKLSVDDDSDEIFDAFIRALERNGEVKESSNKTKTVLYSDCNVGHYKTEKRVERRQMNFDKTVHDAQSSLAEKWPTVAKLSKKLKCTSLLRVKSNLSSNVKKVKSVNNTKKKLPIEKPKKKKKHVDPKDILEALNSSSVNDEDTFVIEVMPNGEISSIALDEKEDDTVADDGNVTASTLNVSDVRDSTVNNISTPVTVTGKRSSRRVSHGRASELASLRKARLDM